MASTFTKFQRRRRHQRLHPPCLLGSPCGGLDTNSVRSGSVTTLKSARTWQVYYTYKNCLTEHGCFEPSYPSFTSMQRELQTIEANRTNLFSDMSCTGVEDSPTGPADENAEATKITTTFTVNTRKCKDHSLNLASHPRYDPHPDRQKDISEIQPGTGDVNNPDSFLWGGGPEGPVDVVSGLPTSECRMPNNASPKSCFCGWRSEDNKELIVRWLKAPAATTTVTISILSAFLAFMFS